MMQSLLADIRHAWKALVRDPGPSLMVVLLLALGIAATISVYSITAGVVLRPLPYAAPESLVQIRQVDPVEGYEYGTSGPTFRDLRESTTSLSGLAVASPGEMILDAGGNATRVSVASVSGDFFRVLGVTPAAGRLLLHSDAEAGGSRVVVLSDALWRERFGGSPDALGRVVRLHGAPYEVVGVAGPDLDLPRGAEAWIPLPPDAPIMEVRGAHILPTFGRLADGATTAAAEAELNAIIEGIPDEAFEARVVLMKQHLVGDFRTPLLILLGAVVFVLLIAAANAGTLLLARTARRRRELAIRDALGAGSRRVATQLLAESTILAVVAGGVGILAAAWILDGLVALAPADLPRAGEVGLDAGVVAFAVVVSLLTGLLTGAIPALRTARTAPVVDLKAGGMRAGGTGRTQRVFVVAEVALSVVLLVGAGLLGRSFYEIVTTDPGFEADRVTTYEFSLPEFRYPGNAQVRSYHERLLDRVRALPEVGGASLAQNLPVGGSYMVTPALVEGREMDDPPRVQVSAVAPGYFETLGLNLVSGRAFDERDGGDAPPVAMVDEAFARLYFDGEDPVGRRARTYFDGAMREIVGVVTPTVHASLTDAPEPRFYYPAAQLPPRSGRLLVRSEAAPAAVIAAVRRAFAAVDPEVPPGDVATMSQLLARTTAGPRFYAMMLSTFAALALVLAVAGFFSVLSQSVTARRREMGVRIAIGAEPGGVLRMVIRQGMTLTAVGLGLGVAGGLAGARLLRGLLHDVGPADPLVLAAVSALLALVALAAAWVPARRAARTDPMETLRVEGLGARGSGLGARGHCPWRPGPSPDGSALRCAPDPRLRPPRVAAKLPSKPANGTVLKDIVMFAASCRRLLGAAFLAVMILPALASHATAQAVEVDTIPERFDFGKMWTYEYPPMEYFTDTYGFDADQAWFDRVRMSVLRVPGCSASFVSPNGLVATNHHCVRGRIPTVAREGESLLDDGFYATTLDEERRIPDYYADRLIAARDVTAEVLGAMDAAASPEERRQARSTAIGAVRDRLRSEFGDDVHVEVRALYHGGRYSAYVFRRFDDVRLVAAVELQAGFFGGDPDNFTYPRYALDFAFLRVYDDGEPFESTQHLGWSLEGVEEGSTVFVVGNPGSTNRLLTMAQLGLLRDVITPVTVRALEDRLEAMRAFYAEDPEVGEAMDLRNTMFSYSNSLKAYSGRLDALRTPSIMTRKRVAQERFVDSIMAEPDLRARFGGLIDSIAAIQTAKRGLADRYGAFRLVTSSVSSPAVLRRGVTAALMLEARQAGDEARADTLAHQLTAIRDLPASLEHGMLTIQLADFLRYLGPESGIASVGLREMTPQEAATSLLEASTLATRVATEKSVESALLEQDIAVRLAQEILPRYQEFAAEWSRLSRREDDLAGELGRARFEVYGTRVPPDGTSSPRITDGVVRPYDYNGTRAPVYTTFYGMYDHYHSYGEGTDWELPGRWLPGPAGLDLETPLNFISTADTYGGNSGSPAITPDVRMVGLNFDRNIEGLSRDFIYLPERGRNIMVDVRAITEALDDVYDADRIVEELVTGRLVRDEANADETARQ